MRPLVISLILTLATAATARAQTIDLTEAPLTDKCFRIDVTFNLHGKITVQHALSNIEEQRMRSLASIRRAREKAIKKAQGVHQESEKVIRGSQLASQAIM